MIVEVIIGGMKLGGALNARLHWAARASKVRRERLAVRASLRQQLRGNLPPPSIVTMRRVASRAMDDDNLAGAFKAVRDEIAEFFGVDDGPRGPISWRYEQRKGAPRQYAVIIQLAWGVAKKAES